MDNYFQNIQIRVNEKIYLKDPSSTDLGKRIVQEAVTMINEIGLERFTFAKLAKKINTTESSIYRYFENKHKILIYLLDWYWRWLDHKLIFLTNNIESAEECLKISIGLLTNEFEGEIVFDGMNLKTLNKIVVSESSKAYLTKSVDDDNKEGFYSGYKTFVMQLTKTMKRINNNFPFPATLISTIVEGVHHQKYFFEHIPTLSDISGCDKDLADFYTEMALATLKGYNAK